jgi:hypothetical protein
MFAAGQVGSIQAEVVAGGGQGAQQRRTWRIEVKM